MKSRKQAVMVLGGVGLGALALYALFPEWRGQHVDGSSAQEKAAHGLPFERGEWIQELREPTEVVFRTPVRGKEDEFQEEFRVVSLGPLPPEAHAKAANVCAIGVGSNLEQASSVDDEATMLRRRIRARKYELAARQLETGDYITVATNGPMMRFPPGYKHLRLIAIGAIEGKMVDVIFPMKLAGSDLVGLYDMLKVSDIREQEEYGYGFNSLPDHEREAKIRAHDEALRIINEANKTPQDSAERVAARERRKDVIAAHFVIDRQRWTIRRRDR